MAFMNFSGFFYARNDLRLFKIEKKNELKSFFTKTTPYQATKML